MSEHGTLLLARAHGRELLLDASQLLEVLPALPVTPLPGPVPGIAGVVLYEGEFLPVFDWGGLPGAAGPAPPSSLAVLKRRLALPLETLSGTVDPGGPSRSIESPEGDPWAEVLACTCSLGGPALPLLDPDRLIAWLHGRRGRR